MSAGTLGELCSNTGCSSLLEQCILCSALQLTRMASVAVGQWAPEALQRYLLHRCVHFPGVGGNWCDCWDTMKKTWLCSSAVTLGAGYRDHRGMRVCPLRRNLRKYSDVETQLRTKFLLDVPTPRLRHGVSEVLLSRLSVMLVSSTTSLCHLKAILVFLRVCIWLAVSAITSTLCSGSLLRSFWHPSKWP